MEKWIGKVPLILDHYSGHDDYNDGDIYEEFLLKATEKYGDIDYSEIIAENPSTPTFYHLSHLRENLLCWYPFSHEEEALEIGAGCGALTGLLARNCKSVDCVDLSNRRCTINANRHRDCDHLRIFVSNFEDFVKSNDRKYSFVTLIGVLEYAIVYIRSGDPFADLLKKAKSMMTQDGTLLVAIENKFGLKYFAGAQEDHMGLFFRGLEGYDRGDFARTFSRKELEGICRRAGFENVKFYYPYPDYKFPTTVFSDGRLPQKGELRENQFNVIHDRYSLFNMDRVFDSMVDAQLFPEFSNSFLVELKVSK